MSLDIGIVGLPNVGKSTLFNAITAQNVDAENYPFCTIEPNIGVVKVPDKQLWELKNIFSSKKIIHNLLNVVDIAGLVKGASKGEGLGNKFLEHIRQVDAIVEVLRCFSNKNISHVDDSIDPIRDIKTIENELLLADLESIEKLIIKETKNSKSSNKSENHIGFLNAISDHLLNSNWANSFIVEKSYLSYFKQLPLLTAKPILLVANLDESIDLNNPHYRSIYKYANNNNIPLIPISAKLESEIALLDENDKINFLKDFGLAKSGLDAIIESGYKLLNQLVFYTAGEKEVRAWNIIKGATLPQAAGKIHTDMQRGFICGEVYNFSDFQICKSELDLRASGKIRLEGKNYLVQNGDIINIRFAV